MYPVPLLDNPQGQTCEAEWETRSDLSFSSPIRMMVRLGLARPRVQPCPRTIIWGILCERSNVAKRGVTSFELLAASLDEEELPG